MVWDRQEPLPPTRFTSVKAGILEGGVDPGNAEMTKNIMEGASFVNRTALSGLYDISSFSPWAGPGACPHGQHVAGTLAGRRCGARLHVLPQL